MVNFGPMPSNREGAPQGANVFTGSVAEQRILVGAPAATQEEKERRTEPEALEANAAEQKEQEVEVIEYDFYGVTPCHAHTIASSASAPCYAAAAAAAPRPPHPPPARQHPPAAARRAARRRVRADLCEQAVDLY